MTDVSIQTATPPAHGEQASAIEQRGIDYIPLHERRGRPLGLSWMWAGAILNVEYVVYGALVVAIGLTFTQALIVILVGNLFFLLTGLASLPGPAAGTTAFSVSRAPFGPNGNRLVSVLNWTQQVGYETLGLSIVVLAALALLGKAGVASSTGVKVAVIVVGASLQCVLPIFGHRAIMNVLTLLVGPFIVLFIILAVLTAGKAHLSGGHSADVALMLGGLALVISSGGLGWTANASDYSRYLPPTASRARIVMAVALGGAVPSALLMILGAAVATAVPSASDPISGLPQAFASWFLVPYLFFVIFQVYAINTLDLYSSGVTLQAIGLKIKRWQAVAFDTVVAGSLTAVTIFSSGFYTFLSDFLLFMIIWFSPWTAIFLIDYFLRRGRYDSRALLDPRPGIYWRDGGFHWPGLVAQLLGMLASASWIYTSPFQGPITKATGGADLSVFMGLVVGGLAYLLLAGPSVWREGERTPSFDENDAHMEAGRSG